MRHQKGKTELKKKVHRRTCVRGIIFLVEIIIIIIIFFFFLVFLITFMFVPLFFWFPIKQASCLLLCNNCLVYLF